MNQKIIAKAEAAIAKRALVPNEGSCANEGYCTVTTIDENGYPTSSTITASKADGIRRLVFGSTLNSDRVNRIKKCNRACVCINSDEYHVSLVGTIEILTDPQSKQDAWYDWLKEYYSGADDPDFCALRFTTERYNLYFIDGEMEDSGTLPKE